MNEITNPNKIKFVSENLGLQYSMEIGDTKEMLKFTDGVCEVDKGSPEAKEAIARYNAQFEDDGKGGKRMKGDSPFIPFTPYDEFEASIVRTPIKVELGKGKYFEVTPQEIEEWREKAKAFDAKKEGKKNA
jgi:hypothetical protein